MKKLLLLLVVMLSCITGVSAETIVFDFTVADNVHGFPNKELTKEGVYTSKINADLIVTFGAYTWWQKNTSN